MKRRKSLFNKDIDYYFWSCLALYNLSEYCMKSCTSLVRVSSTQYHLLNLTAP